jgi:hypothetical protein
MSKPEFLSTNVAALLVYGRPPMVFAGMICAIGVMLDHNPFVYYSGVIFLLAAMILDIIDGLVCSPISTTGKTGPFSRQDHGQSGVCYRVSDGCSGNDVALSVFAGECRFSIGNAACRLRICPVRDSLNAG